jgi:hypothetical protein
MKRVGSAAPIRLLELLLLTSADYASLIRPTDYGLGVCELIHVQQNVTQIMRDHVARKVSNNLRCRYANTKILLQLAVQQG